ncbi:hypothetical protein BC629DRAFT_1475329 [Irpex lacteus]|nr:hypothetical protein BC629DRAFT_1475329 [Irpex lacteus]
MRSVLTVNESKTAACLGPGSLPLLSSSTNDLSTSATHAGLPRSALGVIVAYAATSLAQAQLNFTVPQNCSDDLSWTANDRGQSTCLVAAYLCDACRTNESSTTQEADCSIPNLTPGGQFYVNHNTPNECDCNSVVYSLISACSLCQGAAVLPWTSWIEDCKNSFLEQFPASIPSNVSVPAWAYLDVASSNTFNASIAQSFAETAHLSDSSAVPVPTSSAASSDSSLPSSPPSSSSFDAELTTTLDLSSSSIDSTPPTTTSISLDPASGQTLGALPTVSPSLMSSNTSTSSSAKKLVGPIVGGVVGGLAGIATIAVLAFVWYHNHGSVRQGKAQYDGRASWLSGSVPGVGASGPGALGNWGNGSKIYVCTILVVDPRNIEAGD